MRTAYLSLILTISPLWASQKDTVVSSLGQSTTQGASHCPHGAQNSPGFDRPKTSVTDPCIGQDWIKCLCKSYGNPDFPECK